ncbi:MAG: hypothetical protein HYV96_11835 [Opitutae bacterium]|nr:hypothetical protein [Opitutae bacterium]
MPENTHDQPPDPASPAAPPPDAAADRAASGDTPALFVAHALALAIQDATDNLRHTATISRTVTGVAFARFLATGDPVFLQAIDPAQRSVAQAIATLNDLAATAATTIKNFPAENSP